MKKPYEVLKSALQTEKGAMMRPQNKYLFWVDKNANKIEIKNAVESIYRVTVEKVNTEMARGKNKRVRYAMGKTPDWKKAIVQLKIGDKIDIA
ncbi:MAG: 50S ribosomal protein L23 [Candidatus Omnitrophica bacterium]|nr:50S ribosomal protein L23 [Candidatus Omnitrophota bacterium]MBU4487529.1 50S ribosomal protein L23 [Candidatus Omnitrophota bacterium]MCG2705769.1 50S ribosomal protein L23 [Candidatus Omnitrophota bacterium]